MLRILIADPLADSGLDVLRRHDGVEIDLQNGLDGEELRTALSQADGVIVRSGTELTAAALEGQQRLQAIVRAGVGVDNIDLEAATRAGIVVMNTPAGNTTSTAEHSIAMLMALTRNITPAANSLRRGEWARNQFVGTQLAGKTLGVVGLGRVGLAVCDRARGLHMRVIGFDPFLSKDKAAEFGIELHEDLDALLPECDFLTVHTPLTDQTRGLIDARRLAAMKPGVRIVNCARGGIVDETALVEALENGHVGGAAIDVFENEPPGDNPLLTDPRVLATPHLGASTEEAQESVAIEAADILTGFLIQGEVRHAVNMAPISATELAGIRVYLDLAHRLGLLLAERNRSSRVKAAGVEYRGEVAEKSTRLVTAGFAAGLLSQALDAEVNLVNAEWMAGERGIQLTESRTSESGSFTTLILASLTTDSGTRTAAATVFGNQFLRLVRLDGFQLDAFLDGHLLVVRHHDVPGLIGFIGSVLGEHQVNIAHLSLGREQDKPGGDALAVLNLDSPPDDLALDQLRDHQQVTDVELLSLPAAGTPLPWLGGC
ncbi:MAG: phosphoglycerate dehydrogenase [Planctomycetaceae bacterium]